MHPEIRDQQHQYKYPYYGSDNWHAVNLAPPGRYLKILEDAVIYASGRFGRSLK